MPFDNRAVFLQSSGGCDERQTKARIAEHLPNFRFFALLPEIS
ncbi:MAG: hypothetical protein WKF71_09605 [Pyrinomonadaceae bacterium]